MPSETLPTSARDGYLPAGRDVVVTFDNEDEVRYRE
jgi:hypothetical protein